MYAGVDGNPTRQGDPKLFKVGPRGGFAYTINDTTVIRGGVGLFWGIAGSLVDGWFSREF